MLEHEVAKALQEANLYDLFPNEHKPRVSPLWTALFLSMASVIGAYGILQTIASITQSKLLIFARAGGLGTICSVAILAIYSWLYSVLGADEIFSIWSRFVPPTVKRLTYSLEFLQSPGNALRRLNSHKLRVRYHRFLHLLIISSLVPALLSGLMLVGIDLLATIGTDEFNLQLQLFFYYVVCFVLFSQRLIRFDPGARVFSVYLTIKSAMEFVHRSWYTTLGFIPMLFVLIVLSVFSQEVWLMFSTVPLWALSLAAVLILMPAYLAANSATKPSATTIAELSRDRANIVSALQREGWDQQWNAEEWSGVKHNFVSNEWQLKQSTLDAISSRITRRQGLTVLLTTAIFVLQFSVYFYVLCNLLLQGAIASQWLGGNKGSPELVIWSLADWFWVRLYSPLGPVGIGAIFLATIATSQALAHESVRRAITTELQDKARVWMAATAILSLSQPAVTETQDSLGRFRFQLW
jgi:hypothetical protein